MLFWWLIHAVVVRRLNDAFWPWLHGLAFPDMILPAQLLVLQKQPERAQQDGSLPPPGPDVSSDARRLVSARDDRILKGALACLENKSARAINDEVCRVLAENKEGKFGRAEYHDAVHRMVHGLEELRLRRGGDDAAGACSSHLSVGGDTLMGEPAA